MWLLFLRCWIPDWHVDRNLHGRRVLKLLKNNGLGTERIEGKRQTVCSICSFVFCEERYGWESSFCVKYRIWVPVEDSSTRSLYVHQLGEFLYMRILSQIFKVLNYSRRFIRLFFAKEKIQCNSCSLKAGQQTSHQPSLAKQNICRAVYTLFSQRDTS